MQNKPKGKLISIS